MKEDSVGPYNNEREREKSVRTFSFFMRTINSFLFFSLS